jgi:26S proteasome regulatory subunit N5
VQLAEHHEALAASAPADPSCELVFPLRVGVRADYVASTASTTAPAASASTSTSAASEEKKKEPVTAQDHLNVAADLLSDIQVETYSSMDKREKTEL